jgi:hypothetical protein
MKNKSKLSADQILENWNTFRGYIEEYISSPRKEQLLEMYSDIEEETIMAPASSTTNHHNCFAGGYIDHVNRVIEGSILQHKVWKHMGAHETYTLEELIFSAINHDLGKIGFKGSPNTIPNDNSWEIEKQNKLYKINTVNPFTMVPDRSLFLLQSYGIKISHNEFLGIKLHDGLYDESNRPYYISYNNDSKLRTDLPYVLHQADLMASRIEWESDWLDKLN